MEYLVDEDSALFAMISSSDHLSLSHLGLGFRAKP